MAEYIDRDAALALLKDDREVCADSKEELKYIREDIRSIPAADVVERKVGKWILSEIQRQEDVENDNYQYHCSNCGKGDVHAKGMTVPYCWHCGAQMIGGEDDV